MNRYVLIGVEGNHDQTFVSKVFCSLLGYSKFDLYRPPGKFYVLGKMKTQLSFSILDNRSASIHNYF